MARQHRCGRWIRALGYPERIGMQITIDKRSEVSASDQLRQQIIFLIGTGQLSMGTTMPSVRELARRVKIHHNTVSHVYSQLADEGWLRKRRGSRLVVGKGQVGRAMEDFAGLDDLIDRAILLARSHGYSLQQLTSRVRERLLAEAPDHLLLVAPERELAELLSAEIAKSIGREVETCSVSMLQHDPGIAIGAVLITPAYHLHKVEPFVSADRTLVPIAYSPADEQIAAVRDLLRASVIGVVSVSGLFLETANGLLAPAIGRRHSFREFLLKLSGDRWKLEDYIAKDQSLDASGSWTATDRRLSEALSLRAGAAAPGEFKSADLQGLDLLFCDSVAHHFVRHRNAIKYRLVSDESLGEVAEIANAMLQPGTAEAKGRNRRTRASTP